MKLSTKVFAIISVLFAIIFIYERLTSNTTLPTLFGEMLWFAPLVISIFSYMTAVTINKGYNKSLKLIGFAYIGIAVVGICWYFVVVVMMVTA
ncbi:hypothetical protein AB3N04_04850 [Alkalihalophilus sp. As8PL]|uniref:Uncharacterized protein n=1 Tax=Alkalihalophilus sp. As8PL TaxID=3237103 RepID=A0AB39BWD0_9BACI